MGVQEFDYYITQRRDDQSVFLVAEFAVFHRLGQDAAIQVVVNATDAPTGHVLLCNVPALLYFVHEAGKGGGAPDAAVFQQADEGRLRVVRLQFADVHAGLQFIILYAGIRGNRLQQSPAIGRVIGRGIVGIVGGDNAPARKLGAFHGVPVFPSFGSGYAGGQRLSGARRHATFGGVAPNHAIQALFFGGHGVRHGDAVQRRDVHRFVGFLRLDIIQNFGLGFFLFFFLCVLYYSGCLFSFHHNAFLRFVIVRVCIGCISGGGIISGGSSHVFIAPRFADVGVGVLQERHRVCAAVGPRIRDVSSLIQMLTRQHGVGGGQVQFVAGLLLQCARGQRQRRWFRKRAHLGRTNDVLKFGGCQQECGAGFGSSVPSVQLVFQIHFGEIAHCFIHNGALGCGINGALVVVNEAQGRGLAAPR